jgi:pimeloyl-ACP methyl ester carboxylesterase
MDILKSYRLHGTAPYSVATIHGGPGATGEMEPVARELASDRGVIEPFQTEDTIDGQVRELVEVLERHADPPVVLIGHSWGAWLSFITAARHPDLVRKLILVGCPPFEKRFVPRILETRLDRLNESERNEFENLLKELNDPSTENKSVAFVRLIELTKKTDSFNPIPDLKSVSIPYDGQAVIFGKVWNEAEAMRRSGELLDLAERIRCPLAAIHGDHDPHPADGVRFPLLERINEFEWIQLDRCGHKPWIERFARDRFFETLRQIIF